MDIMFDKVTGLFLGTLSDAALRALRAALESDDARLIQGATTLPPPLMCVQDWPVEGACLVGYGYWQGDGLETVGEVEECLAMVAMQIETELGVQGAISCLLNWWDEGERPVVIRVAIGLVDDEVRRRRHLECE